MEAFGVHRYMHQVNIVGREGAEEVVGHRVSANLFELLGVRPALGAPIQAGADRETGPREALIGHTWWKRRFGGDPGVVGRQIQVGDESFTIAGVMPPGFEFPPMGSATYRPVIWMSLNQPAEQERARELHALAVIARLRAGVTMQRAQTEMATIGARLAKAYPKENGGWGVEVTSLTDVRQLEDVRPALFLLMAAASLVLLIACANIANLLVARAAGREREMAVRRALGVTWPRLVRQLLTESGLLALFGGLAGVLLAYGAADSEVRPAGQYAAGRVDRAQRRRIGFRGGYIDADRTAVRAGSGCAAWRRRWFGFRGNRDFCPQPDWPAPGNGRGGAGAGGDGWRRTSD